jgi:hypothetical protein
LTETIGAEALADIVTREVGVLLLQEVVAPRIVVHDLGKSGAEALDVHAALFGVDVIGEAHDILRIAGIPLHGNLDLALLLERGVGVGLALDVDRLGAARQDLLLIVQELDEVDDAALVAELIRTRGVSSRSSVRMILRPLFRRPSPVGGHAACRSCRPSSRRFRHPART